MEENLEYIWKCIQDINETLKNMEIIDYSDNINNVAKSITKSINDFTDTKYKEHRYTKEKDIETHIIKIIEDSNIFIVPTICKDIAIVKTRGDVQEGIKYTLDYIKNNYNDISQRTNTAYLEAVNETLKSLNKKLKNI